MTQVHSNSNFAYEQQGEKLTILSFLGFRPGAAELLPNHLMGIYSANDDLKIAASRAAEVVISCGSGKGSESILMMERAKRVRDRILVHELNVDQAKIKILWHPGETASDIHVFLNSVPTPHVASTHPPAAAKAKPGKHHHHRRHHGHA